ncbi:MAG: hypothetical protein ACI9MB_005317 [Verrucomicrobiales bacterium]|jgi:hypothetical protein
MAAATAVSLAPLKLMFACLPEGTQIDIPGGKTKAIESLRSGDLVIGYDGQAVRILQIHGYLEDPKATDFYTVSFSNGASVDLCSMHRIGNIRAKDLHVDSFLPNGLSVVEIKIYRGVERSYDLLTEDPGYRIGAIPVNSMIEEMYEVGRTGQLQQ